MLLSPSWFLKDIRTSGTPLLSTSLLISSIQPRQDRSEQYPDRDFTSMESSTPPVDSYERISMQPNPLYR